jgi:hypothetical protein
LIHRSSPFHRIKIWNGCFFKKHDLDALGLTIFLGHGGEPCPNLSYDGHCPGNHAEDADGDVIMNDTINGDEEWQDVPFGFVGDRVRVVNTTGIFSRRVRWCECQGDDGAIVAQDMQLLEHQLYPATSDRPSTVFTFNVLDEFIIDSLECKTSAWTFLAKLRRLTDAVFPLSTPVSYQL